MPDKDRELQIARAEAIEAYAEVESELCYVLSALLNVRHDTTAIVFFKIGNTGSRNSIIASLLDHVHGDKFKVYWHGQPGGGATPKVPGLFNHIKWLDLRRNEIVHWHRVSSASGGPDGITKHWEDYRPPFFWARSKAAPINKSALDSFITRATFVKQALHIFWMATRHPQKFAKFGEGALEAWLQIFQQPLPYPLPEDHPLRQKLSV
jgi:hypothetical protein